MNLTELVQKLSEAKKKKLQLMNQYQINLSSINSEISTISKHLSITNVGLDLEMVNRGMLVIEFGETKGINERNKCVDDAISDLAGGAKKLNERYFGTKDYAHWNDQREDHEYGYGPKHGSIVFRVGLRHEFLRKKLTPDDIECAIYCLLNINKINEQIKQVA
ncbi:hypothetical protein ACETF5_004349 [Yersinia enterocolitica]